MDGEWSLARRMLMWRFDAQGDSPPANAPIEMRMLSRGEDRDCCTIR